jgi:hypothetical protein
MYKEFGPLAKRNYYHINDQECMDIAIKFVEEQADLSQISTNHIKPVLKVMKNLHDSGVLRQHYETLLKYHIDGATRLSKVRKNTRDLSRYRTLSRDESHILGHAADLSKQRIFTEKKPRIIQRAYMHGSRAKELARIAGLTDVDDREYSLAVICLNAKKVTSNKQWARRYQEHLVAAYETNHRGDKRANNIAKEITRSRGYEWPAWNPNHHRERIELEARMIPALEQIDTTEAIHSLRYQGRSSREFALEEHQLGNRKGALEWINFSETAYRKGLELQRQNPDAVHDFFFQGVNELFEKYEEYKKRVAA